MHEQRYCIVLNSTVLYRGILYDMVLMVSLVHDNTPRSFHLMPEYTYIHNRKIYEGINIAIIGIKLKVIQSCDIYIVSLDYSVISFVDRE